MEKKLQAFTITPHPTIWKLLAYPHRNLMSTACHPEGDTYGASMLYEFNAQNLPLSSGCTSPFLFIMAINSNIISPYQDEVVTTGCISTFLGSGHWRSCQKRSTEYEIRKIDLTEYLTGRSGSPILMAAQAFYSTR